MMVVAVLKMIISHNLFYLPLLLHIIRALTQIKRSLEIPNRLSHMGKCVSKGSLTHDSRVVNENFNNGHEYWAKAYRENNNLKRVTEEDAEVG